MKWFNRFHLSDTEQKGFTVLAIILILAVFFRLGVLFLPDKEVEVQSTLQEEMALWQAEMLQELIVPHAFDPNTVQDSLIHSFKISAFAAENWIKFRQRGRLFLMPEDVLGIYGMDTTWYLINKDSIQIATHGDEVNRTTSVTLFAFDPNTVTQSQMLELGFPEWLAKRVVNYRKAGGRFKTAEDLLKIYGFPKELFKRLFPYIQIVVTNAETHTKAPKDTLIEKEQVKVLLNTCDSVTLIQVKGIGPYYAQRILKLRKQLGGYYRLEQLLEVYGITPEMLEAFNDQLVIDVTVIKKLNINTATFKELLSHKYLNYEQVKSIVNYRERIQPFKTVEEISNLPNISTADLERLKYYLIVD